MRKQTSFRTALATFRNSFGVNHRHLSGRRWHRLQVAVVGVVLSLAMVAQTAAQTENAASCSRSEAVPVGMQGLMCAFGSFDIKLAGETASGLGFECHGLFDWTPKVWPKLIPDKTYTVTAGLAICVTSINFDVPEGYTLYIDGLESKTIDKSDGGRILSGDGSWSVVLRKNCNCGKDKPAAAVPRSGSVIWEAGMGTLADGRSAEHISIREKVLTASSYTPSALIYSPPANTTAVDVVRSLGNLRQIKAPQTFADIVTINSSEYEIRYYAPANVGAKDGGGLYQLTGQPYVTWKITNPTPSTTKQLHIKRYEGGQETDRTEYLWDPAVDSWTMSTGWSPTTGFSRIETTTVSNPTPTSRTETIVVKEGASPSTIVSKVTKTYGMFPWGEELVQQVVDPDVSALTTSYTYYENASEDRRYRKVKSITFPNGSWEKYDYDVDYNISTILRPWKDQPMATATVANSHATIYGYSNTDNGVVPISQYARIPYDVEEKIQGVTVRKTRLNRNVVAMEPEILVSTAESSYSGSSNGEPVNLLKETITTRYYLLASEFLRNRVQSIQFPDGRKDTYEYEKGNYLPNVDPALSQFVADVNGLAERETIIHGTVAAPQGLAFKTTKDVVVRDQYGNNVLQEIHVYNGTGYERIAWTAFDYDNRGHVVTSRNHKGELTTAVWTGEQLTSQVAASGVETVYEYDSLKRIRKQTKKGISAGGGFPAQADIVTTIQYDAEGRQTSQTVGEGPGSLTTSRVYDRAGRTIRETKPGELSTTYAYTNGGRTQTITRPGGSTEILDKYLDGQAKTVSGTAVVSRAFDYGVNPDGTRYTQEFVGSGGLSSPRWTRTTSDWVDRTIAVEMPSFTGTNVIESSIYNALGQLQKQTVTANTTKVIADELFEYDVLGQRIRRGSDIDASGTLTLLSTDRLAETDYFYEKTGSDWFKVISSKTYLTDNDDTPTVQTTRERLNNFPLNGTEQTVSEVTSIDVAGNITTTTTSIDRAAKKFTTTIDKPDSTTNGVMIAVNELLQSSSPTTPQTATTFAYDTLGRQISATDPLSGTASRTFNTSGQLESATEGAGTTSFTYYDKSHVNAGRVKSQTNAAGKTVYFNYNSRGELIQKWGDATHPLEYVFDAYGQPTELRTFRGGQNWGASVWPASTTGTADMTKWFYQESTGLLTQKQDPALKGPTYTYDELGRMKTRVWARGITCTYVYDANTGELRTITYSDSTPSVSLSYDRGGRQTNIVDAAGSYTRTFNAEGHLQTEQITGGILDGVGVTVGYDSFLRRNSLQTSHGANTLSSQTYGYDATSRLGTITSGSQTATYGYFPTSGLPNTTSFTDGTNVTRSFDSFGRLQSISTAPSAAAARSYVYAYNNLNQRTQLTREDGSYWTYVYNDRGELFTGKKFWPDNSIVWGAQTEYNFDNIGNRKSAKNGGNELGSPRQSGYTATSLNQYSQRTVPGAIDILGTANSTATVTVNNQTTVRKGDYFYKELNVDNSAGSAYAQITVVGAKNNFGAGGEDAVSEKGGRVFVPQAVETFSYDFDGNLTSDGRWLYSWDAENQLIAMEAAVAVPAEAKRKLEFAYDFGGRRIQKKVYAWNVGTSTYQLQSVTKFVYDHWNLMAELDAGNALIRSYVWGKDVGEGLQSAGGIGGLLTINEGAYSYNVGYDGSSNIVTLVKAGAGTISAEYEYDPYGNNLKSIGEYANNPFRFSTKYTDSETGLVYYGYRYADSQTGRWLSKDPLGEAGGVNLYRHTNNDPISSIDPLGLQIRERNFDSRDRNPATGERYGAYRDYDRWEAERRRQLRQQMIRALPNPTGRPGLEFLPDPSNDSLISKWKGHIDRWFKEMLKDCDCKKAFKDAGLDLDAVNELGVIVGSVNTLPDQGLTDEQVKVPRDIRYGNDVKNSMKNDPRGFSFFVPGSPDTRHRLFLGQSAFSDGFGNLWESAACSLRRTFVHELIHSAGAGKQDPSWVQKQLGYDDLTTWMPREYAKIIAACGCK